MGYSYKSEKEVRKFMNELEDVRLINIQRRGLGKTNIYTLLSIRNANLTSLYEELIPSASPEPERGSTPSLDRGNRPVLEQGNTPVKEYEELRIQRKKNTKEEYPGKSNLECLEDESVITALQEKFPEVNVPLELEKCRNWVQAKGAKYRDYVSFARNWMIKATEIIDREAQKYTPQNTIVNLEEEKKRRSEMMKGYFNHL